jgi:ribosome recycling factor
MAYNFNNFKQGAEGALEWLRKEYSGLRTGKAAPAILDTVLVDAYGSKMPINQVANVNLEGPQSIRIVPWDASVSKSIESAIQQSNLGLSVSIDDKGLRVNFPSLTSERRTELAKVAKQKLEEARIRVRTEREKVHSDVDRQEKASEMGKDDAFRAKQDLQKLVDETNKKLEDLYDKKEKEILE